MRYYVCLALAMVVATIATPVCGHGIPLTISSDSSNHLFNPLLVTYDDEEGQLEGFPVSAPSILRGAAGFYPEFGVIPAGTALTIDVSGSSAHPLTLLFWDGTSVEPSPVTIDLTRTGISLHVSPTDTFLTGGTLPPYDGQLGGHSALTISMPLSSPIGLYGIGFQASSPGYSRSETFWAIANNGVIDPADVERGLADISRAVPEPSGMALAVCAGLMGLWVCARSRG